MAFGQKGPLFWFASPTPFRASDVPVAAPARRLGQGMRPAWRWGGGSAAPTTGRRQPTNTCAGICRDFWLLRSSSRVFLAGLARLVRWWVGLSGEEVRERVTDMGRGPPAPGVWRWGARSKEAAAATTFLSSSTSHPRSPRRHTRRWRTRSAGSRPTPLGPPLLLPVGCFGRERGEGARGKGGQGQPQPVCVCLGSGDGGGGWGGLRPCLLDTACHFPLSPPLLGRNVTAYSDS